MTLIYPTRNGVKPRFDGHGSEFGSMHRELGPGFLMTDIDRVDVDVAFSIEHENTHFYDYRIVFGRTRVVAVYEVKAHKTPYAEAEAYGNTANAKARRDIAFQLNARYLVVFATNNQQPFEYNEVDTISGAHWTLGVLDYTDANMAEAAQRFYRDVLGIRRVA